MKLNKKIVAGLATAALFAPLALNDVQVSANDTDTVGNNASNQSISKGDLASAFNDYQNQGANLGEIKNHASDIKIKNIASDGKKVKDNSDTNDYKLSLQRNLLTGNNGNQFIKGLNNDSDQNTINNIISTISNINDESQKIQNPTDDYKASLLKALFNKSENNGHLDSSKVNANGDNVKAITENIKEINSKYNSNNGSNNTDNYESNIRSDVLSNYNKDNFLTGFNESTDKSTFDSIVSTISSINDESQKIQNPTDDYKASLLKALFNKSGNNDHLNSSKVNANGDNVKAITDGVKNISDNQNISKIKQLQELLTSNGVTNDNTGIDVSTKNEGTLQNIVDSLYNLYNKNNTFHSSSNQQIVVTSNNNSNSNNTNQSSKPTETNNSHEVQFPSAPKSDNVVKDSHATKVNNAKSDVKKAEKQLANAKSNKAKNNAIKSINKAKANLAKLNGDQKSTLMDAKKSVKKAEKQVKKAKTSDARKSANASLKAAQTNYTQLNKYIK